VTPPVPDAIVTRARSAIGRSTRYVLGRGGMKPDTPHPADDEGGCDCSGFAAWALGISRWIREGHPLLGRFDGSWFETSAVVRNARLPGGPLAPVEWSAARPGCLIVYGDRKLPTGRTSQGHIGVVTEADGSGPLAVCHCSSGNWKRTEDAIQETPVEAFWMMSGARVVYPAWLEAVA
jgi:cell wall-associated NlpC family hydrolase